MVTEDEFSFIHRFFGKINPDLENDARNNGLVLGIGDDAALLNLNGPYAVTTDTLVENVHFFSNFNAKILGGRALDVNFSDLYAMGAVPKFATLSLNIPDRFMDFDVYWSGFSEGLAESLRNHHCTLIGGNICRTNARTAPLTITVTAIGKSLDPNRSFRRSAAKVGDIIMCTGTLAGNGLYVKATYNNVIRCLDLGVRQNFEHHAFSYDPRMAKFVEMLLPYCECAIDVSDGLLGDLSHILVQSKCAAQVNFESLPIDPLAKALSEDCRVSAKSLMRLALAGGGDYNLLFTISPENKAELEALMKNTPEMRGFKITAIGEIVEPTLEQRDDLDENFLATSCGLITLVNQQGEPVNLKLGAGSFNHFIANSDLN